MASSVLNVFVSKYLHLVEASLYFSLSIALSSKEKSRSINRKMFILLEILTKISIYSLESSWIAQSNL